MQILTCKNDLVKYIFTDDDIITIGDNSITTSGYCIGDLNKDCCTLYKGVKDADIPDDFIGNAYKYIGDTFVKSEYYTELMEMVAVEKLSLTNLNKE